jgi:DNA mismatch repair protein MutS2
VEVHTPSERSLLDLEWPEVCAKLADYALSDLARKAALALAPAEEQETAELRLLVLKEALALQDQGASIPAGMVRECGEVIERLRRDSVASAEELHRLLQVLRVAGELDRFGATHDGLAPTLGRVLAVSQELGPLARRLHEVLDDEGEVRDDASPGIQGSRAALKSLRRQIQKRLEELIKRYREALQDGFYAERDGRYVLPVRADAPFRVEGTVLDTSASASTLYVEPREISALGNQLRMAELEVAREIALLLAQISSELSPHAEELLWAQGVCVRADLIFACVKFSVAIGARVVPFGKPGELRLLGARHPLLCLGLTPVVANDLSLSPGRALVLSGPNAGGKTVALKTMGLIAVMQATGLPVPVDDNSEVGFFHEVLSDIGDDQSLSMSLSSFSGHVERVRDILDEAGHGSLVLFDELMSGTDPNEGAALAIATIFELLGTGASVCATTHYEALKEHATVAESFDNAAVGFDFDRMAPTFTVEMGRPGASSALIVAERHGLPLTVIRHGEALLPEVVSQARRERLALEQESQKLMREREAMARTREEQEKLNRRMEREAEKLKEARIRDLGRESDELRRQVAEARAQLRGLKKKLSAAGAPEISQLEKELSQVSSVVALGSPAERELRSASAKTSSAQLRLADLKKGKKVRVKGFSSEGEILEEPKKGKVLVLIGVMKMSVPLGELTMDEVGAGTAKSGGTRRSALKATRTSILQPDAERAAPVRSEELTLDLRGKRVEESLLEVDHFVDELLRRQEFGGFVLHGHGTGALKDAVRQHLSAHPCISFSRAAERDEGGDAFSVCWLSGGG